MEREGRSFYKEAFLSLKESVREVEQRLEKFARDQDTEGEFLRIRDDDSINEAKSEMRQYVKQEFDKISNRVEDVIYDTQADDSILEWAIKKQFLDFQELLQNQQKIVRRLDELSNQQSKFSTLLGLSPNKM